MAEIVVISKLTLKCQKMKTVAFANSVDADEVAHNEPSHLNLQCLPPVV